MKKGIGRSRVVAKVGFIVAAVVVVTVVVVGLGVVMIVIVAE